MKRISISDILVYSLLFVCISTSNSWSPFPETSTGEILRFDKILLFGEANIYHLFAGLFFLILFYVKLGPNNDRNILGERNFLKNIFWAYFIPVNILVYLTVYMKGITLKGLGVYPVMTFFVYLVVVFYIQDIFLRDKDRKQLSNILTVLEIFLLYRCFYSIIKYLLGFGLAGLFGWGVRLGTENDFADFFVLLFIIALVRLLFGRNEGVKYRILHIISIITSSCLCVFSFRRYFWVEVLAATSIILFFHSRFNKVVFTKKVAVACCLIVLMIGSVLLAGPDRIADNYYVGRLLTSLTLVSPRFDSQYGTDTGHRAEIADGWYNVKTNWLLGVTPFGHEKIKRFESAIWQYGLFIHNAYFQVWLFYGLLGVILFILLYVKSIQLGYHVFLKFKNEIGIVLISFMVAQMLKNIVWPTAIVNINLTIIYIFLISFVLRIKRLAM